MLFTLTHTHCPLMGWGSLPTMGCVTSASYNFPPLSTSNYPNISTSPPLPPHTHLVQGTLLAFSPTGSHVHLEVSLISIGTSICQVPITCHSPWEFTWAAAIARLKPPSPRRRLNGDSGKQKGRCPAFREM